MKNIILVHIGESTDDFLNDGGALLEGKYCLFLLGLNGRNVSKIAILHDHEYPSIIYIANVIPSKVRINLTIFWCSNPSIRDISCFKYRLSRGFLTNCFLLVHLTEYSSDSYDGFETKNTIPKPPLPNFLIGYKLFFLRVYLQCLIKVSSIEVSVWST